MTREQSSLNATKGCPKSAQKQRERGEKVVRNITIVNEANQLLIAFQKLQDKINRKVRQMRKHDNLPTHIDEVICQLETLGMNDVLEEAITNAYDCESIIENNHKNGIHVHILK